jgi:AP endonuclease 1
MSATVRRRTISAAKAVNVASKRARSSSLDEELPNKKAHIVKDATLQESQVTLVSSRQTTSVIESQATVVETQDEKVSTKVTKMAKKKSSTTEPNPKDYPPRKSCEWKVGAHISAAGGIENAIANAANIGSVHGSIHLPHFLPYLSEPKRLRFFSSLNVNGIRNPCLRSP